MEPSSGEKFATWVVNVEFKTFGNTTRSFFALQDAKSIANIGALPYLVMYDKMCDVMLIFWKKISVKEVGI